MAELTEFEASELARILRDIKSSVLDKDWKRLEAKADDLKGWCVWREQRKQVEARKG
ncbi:hypothetical protein ES703_62489 [subsurface metagenome]